MRYLNFTFSAIFLLFCNILGAQSNFPLIIGDQINGQNEKPYSMVVNTDGSFVVLASKNENSLITTDNGIFLAKYDSSGQQIWEKFFRKNTGIANYLMASDIIKDPSGGYIIVGDSSIESGMTISEVNMLLTKIDEQGNRIWTTYTSAGLNDFDTDRRLVASTDARYFFVLGGYNIYKFNWTGQIDWQISPNYYLTDAIATPDSGIAAISSNNTKLIKYNSVGDTLWTRNLNYIPKAISANAANTAWAITGFQSGNPTFLQNSVISQHFTDGQTDWQQTYIVKNQSQGRDIFYSNQTLFVTGISKSCLNTDTLTVCLGPYSAFVLKADAANSGQELERKIFGDSSYHPYAIMPVDTGRSISALKIIPAANDEVYMMTDFMQFNALQSPLHGLSFNLNQSNNDILVYKMNGLDLNPVSSISFNQVYSNLQIFPNPTNDVIYIAANEIEIIQFSLYNLSGQLMALFPGYIKSFDLSNYTEGIYILKVSSPKKTLSFKIIKH